MPEHRQGRYTLQAIGLLVLPGSFDVVSKRSLTADAIFWMSSGVTSVPDDRMMLSILLHRLTVQHP
ncbi:hypothetical protein, partial [Parabacteroides distasonis]|uniref:hypothetical protein n=1 Tax=Parabacteroides distasonis TaxID=823 RepID=UPI00124989A3